MAIDLTYSSNNSFSPYFPHSGYTFRTLQTGNSQPRTRFFGTCHERSCFRGPHPITAAALGCFCNASESELILRLLKISLPAFNALRNIELDISKNEFDLFDVLRSTGKCFQVLNAHYLPTDIAKISNLRELMLYQPDIIDFEAIRAVLDQNEKTLKQLILGRASDLSRLNLDLVFQSAAIDNLTHLQLYGENISGFVLGRIERSKNLQSLTLHGPSKNLKYVSEMFGNGLCTRLPNLESFGFLIDDRDEDVLQVVYSSLIHFLQCHREKLRRLDLGDCPDEILKYITPSLKNLRVLGIEINKFTQDAFDSVFGTIPTQMVAIILTAGHYGQSLDEYVHYFTRFQELSFLDLQVPTSASSEPAFLHDIATAIPSLDYLAYNDGLYVVERSCRDVDSAVALQKVPNCMELVHASSVVSEDIVWLRQQNWRTWLYVLTNCEYVTEHTFSI